VVKDTYINLIHVHDRGGRADSAQAVANAFIKGHAPEGTVVPSLPPEGETGWRKVTDLLMLGTLRLYV
jgi:hypothetical protein